MLIPPHYLSVNQVPPLTIITACLYQRLEYNRHTMMRYQTGHNYSFPPLRLFLLFQSYVLAWRSLLADTDLFHCAAGPVHVARLQLLHPAHQHLQPRDPPNPRHHHRPRSEQRHTSGPGIRWDAPLIRAAGGELSFFSTKHFLRGIE